MSNKWIVFLLFLYVIGMTLGATFENTPETVWTPGGGVTTETTNTLEYILDARHIAYQTSSTGDLHFVGINNEYFSAWWKLMTFDFKFFEHYDLEIVRWIIFVPLAGALVFGMLTFFISVIQGFIPGL